MRALIPASASTWKAFIMAVPKAASWRDRETQLLIVLERRARRLMQPLASRAPFSSVASVEAMLMFEKTTLHTALVTPIARLRFDQAKPGRGAIKRVMRIAAIAIQQAISATAP